MKYANLGTTSSLQDMMGITAVYQNFTGDKALKGVYDFITKEEKLTERQKELANEFKTAIRDDLFLNPDEEITKDIFKGFIDEQIVPNFEDTYVKSIVKKAKKLGQKMAEERDKIIKEQLEYQGAIEQANKDNFGSIVVVENVFAFKQVIPLKEGDNLIGRRHPGMNVDVPIETSDPSMDRRHCYINVSRNKKGKFSYKIFIFNR